MKMFINVLSLFKVLHNIIDFDVASEIVSEKFIYALLERNS